jgi:hypothetical protein
MNAALALARCTGLAVRFADLGDWGEHELRAEYDPAAREIRINTRTAARLPLAALEEFIRRAIEHELDHHRYFLECSL